MRDIEKTILLTLILLLMITAAVPYQPATGPHSIASVAAFPPVPGFRAGGMTNRIFAGDRAMGMADIGANPNGSNYSYHTSSVMGSIMLINATTDPASIPFTVQLNAVVVFNASRKEYAFWMQDVASVNTTTKHVYFMDNVWNYSNPYITMSNSSVRGNGTMNKYGNQVYYGAAATSHHTVYPALISLKMAIVGSDVQMYYGVNGIFTLFDNISFFVSSVPTFFVSSGDAPSGNACDLEFVIGGYGDAASATFSSMNATLSLSYWNGFNYQAVPSAVNYALDTAESTTNINVTFVNDGNGSPGARAAVGNQTLHYLYTKAETSTLSVTSTVPGVLYINNFQIPMTWHAVLSLWPGTYNVSFTHSGVLVYDNMISFIAGQSTNIAIEPHKYAVSFHEAGNVSWMVTIDNQSAMSASSIITFLLANGSYSYDVSLSPNAFNNSSVYYPFPYKGVITVNGRNVTVNVSLVVPLEVSFRSNYYPFVVKVNGVQVFIESSSPVILPMANLQMTFPLLYVSYGVVYYPFNSSSNFSTNYTPSSSSNYTFHIYYQQNFLLGLFSNGHNVSAAAGTIRGDANSSLYIPANSTVYLNASYSDGRDGFQGWTGEGIGSYSGNNENMIIVMRGHVNETAVYSRLFTLTVHVGGIFYGGWAVKVGQRTFHSGNKSLEVFLANGSYSVSVIPPIGFSASSSIFNVTMAGTNISHSLSFNVNYGWFEKQIVSVFISEHYSFYIDAAVVVILACLLYVVFRSKKK